MRHYYIHRIHGIGYYDEIYMGLVTFLPYRYACGEYANCGHHYGTSKAYEIECGKCRDKYRKEHNREDLEILEKLWKMGDMARECLNG